MSTRSEEGEACLASFFLLPKVLCVTFELPELRCHTSLANIQDRTALVEKARKVDSQATGKLDSLTLVFPPCAETSRRPHARSKVAVSFPELCHCCHCPQPREAQQCPKNPPVGTGTPPPSKPPVRTSLPPGPGKKWVIWQHCPPPTRCLQDRLWG